MSKRLFTLYELAIVIVVLAIIAAIEQNEDA